MPAYAPSFMYGDVSKQSCFLLDGARRRGAGGPLAGRQKKIPCDGRVFGSIVRAGVNFL